MKPDLSAHPCSLLWEDFIHNSTIARHYSPHCSQRLTSSSASSNMSIEGPGAGAADILMAEPHLDRIKALGAGDLGAQGEGAADDPQI